jgi:SulP family sulfate permease
VFSPPQTIPLGLAILLRLITTFFTHPLLFPAFFILVPLVFYVTVAALGSNLETLRQDGWVFDVKGVDTPWYQYFYYFGELRTVRPCATRRVCSERGGG